VFGGTASQTFTLTGATDKYNGDITINKSKRDRDARLGYGHGCRSDIDVTSGTLNLNGNNLSVDGTLSQSGGIFSGASGAIDIDYELNLSGGTFTSTSGTLTLGGNFYVSNSPTFNSNSGTVTFDGSSNTTADVNSTFTFNNLTINKSGSASVQVASSDTLIATGATNFTDGQVTTAGSSAIEARGNVHGGLDLRWRRH